MIWLVLALTALLAYTAWRITSALPAETLARIGPYRSYRQTRHCPNGQHMFIIPPDQYHEAVKRDKPSTRRVCVMCRLESKVRVFSEANEDDEVPTDSLAYFRIRGSWGEPVPYGDGSRPQKVRNLP